MLAIVAMATNVATKYVTLAQAAEELYKEEAEVVAVVVAVAAVVVIVAIPIRATVAVCVLSQT